MRKSDKLPSYSCFDKRSPPCSLIDRCVYSTSGGMARKKPGTLSRERSAESPPNSADLYEFTIEDLQTSKIDLVELTNWPPRQGERGQVFPIWPDLRVAEETVVTGDWRIVIHLTRAELAATFIGCRVARGTRYGDRALAPSVETTQTETGETASDRSAKGAVAVEGSLLKGLSAAVGLRLRGRTSTRSRKATRRQSKLIHQRVATLPNDRWEISEPDGQRLRGSYLVAPAADEVTETCLCRVEGEADQLLITLSLEIRPEDLDPDIARIEGSSWPPWSAREKPNKLKLAKLLVTRAASEQFGRDGDERITLARTILRGSYRNTGG